MNTPTQIRDYIKAVNPPENNEYARALAAYLWDNQECFTWRNRGNAYPDDFGVDGERLYEAILKFESTRI